MNFKVKEFFIVLTTTLIISIDARGQNCRPIEFQEIKEMSTHELKELTCKYYSNVDSLTYDRSSAQSLNAIAPSLAGSIEIKSLESKLEQCQTETDRLVSLLKKRKDLKNDIKTNATGCLRETEMIEKYRLLK
jgi:cell shape-determining protein MreC